MKDCVHVYIYSLLCCCLICWFLVKFGSKSIKTVDMWFVRIWWCDYVYLVRLLSPNLALCARNKKYFSCSSCAIQKWKFSNNNSYLFVRTFFMQQIPWECMSVLWKIHSYRNLTRNALLIVIKNVCKKIFLNVTHFSACSYGASCLV